jgi:hypothetical protein
MIVGDDTGPNQRLRRPRELDDYSRKKGKAEQQKASIDFRYRPKAAPTVLQ